MGVYPLSSWHRYSIYKRLIAVTILSFAVQAILMAGVTYTRYHSGLSQANATFEALMNKNEQHISEQFDAVKNIASSVGYSSDVQEYFLSATPGERVDNYQSLKYMFSLLLNTNPALKAIYVRNEDGVFLSGGDYAYLFDSFRMDYGFTWENLPRKSFFSKIYYRYDDKQQQTPYCICYLPVNALTSVSHTDDKQFYCAVLFDMAQLLEMDSAENDSIEILTYEGNVLAVSHELTHVEEILRHTQADSDSVVARMDGKDYYMRSLKLDVDTPLLYTFISPMDTLMGNVTMYVNFSVTMIAVCFIVTVCLLFSMRNSIIQPIRQMTFDMQNVTDASGIIRPTQAQELNVLSTGINQMLHKLRDIQKQALVQQQKYYQMNLEKTQAEMMSYRSQMNPHFLFNTLECMCGMARYHGIEELEKLTIAMADSYRYVLRTPDYAHLEQEIAHVRNYMQIMDIRYPGRFYLDVNVQKAALGVPVLSMLLQPLVENAVLHGFSDYDKAEPCTISIDAQMDEQELHIQVQDNGTGLSQKRLDEVRARMYDDHIQTEHSHIGLRNIYRRLYSAYGGDGRMEIHSQEGQYTRIEIVIPVKK